MHMIRMDWFRVVWLALYRSSMPLLPVLSFVPPVGYLDIFVYAAQHGAKPLWVHPRPFRPCPMSPEVIEGGAF